MRMMNPHNSGSPYAALLRTEFFYIEKSVKSEIKATFSVPLYKNIFYI